MAYKVNCWEFMKCGRQPGGEDEAKEGPCPAALEFRTHGVNQGVNGGRACWAIPRTVCGGDVQGNHLQKLHQCMQCDFYTLVRSEEGSAYMGSKEIMTVIRTQSGRNNTLCNACGR